MSLAAGYFDGMYAASADPWGLASRWYEARKYAVSLALLPSRHYAAGFEPGCSIGVLSELLAARCGRLVCWDVSAAAARSARARLAGRPGAEVAQRAIPADWPAGRFDLVVFSELLYYFAGADLGRVLDLGTSCLRPGGSLLAVHWRHPVPDYPRSGDEVHAALARQPGLARLAEHREADFLAELYQRGDRARSVAQAEGLV